MKTVSKNKFKPFTPAWEKAWISYMKEIDAVRRKYNIPMEQWSMEISDEPRTESMPDTTRAAELACKTVPGLKFMLTLASWKIPPEVLEKILPYIHEWCFWSARYYTDPVYAPLIAKIRARKKLLTICMCSTSMRMSLQRYFRYQPWPGPCFRLDGCNMYQHTTYEYKFRDWKESARGEVVLMAGSEPVTTIRNECFVAGFTDLKYYAKLRELYGKMDSASPLAKEIAQFLEEAPKRIVRNPPDNAFYYEEIRARMIDLIGKALKKP